MTAEDAMKIITIDYTNYRGERGTRRVLPYEQYFGTTPFHPDPQWLMRALDVEKNAERTFAMKDIHDFDVKHPVDRDKWLTTYKRDHDRFEMLMIEGACNEKSYEGFYFGSPLKAKAQFRYWCKREEVEAYLDEMVEDEMSIVLDRVDMTGE